MADTFPASDPPPWGGGITGARDAAPWPQRRPAEEKAGAETERGAAPPWSAARSDGPCPPRRLPGGDGGSRAGSSPVPVPVRL